MKYMLLMFADELNAPKTPDEYQVITQAWYGFGEEAKSAGVLLSNNGWEPVASVTTVRVRDGKALITDGPFAQTHEQLGGYYLLDCKDLDDPVPYQVQAAISALHAEAQTSDNTDGIKLRCSMTYSLR